MLNVHLQTVRLRSELCRRIVLHYRLPVRAGATSRAIDPAPTTSSVDARQGTTTTIHSDTRVRSLCWYLPNVSRVEPRIVTWRVKARRSYRPTRRFQFQQRSSHTACREVSDALPISLGFVSARSGRVFHRQPVIRATRWLERGRSCTERLSRRWMLPQRPVSTGGN